MMFIVRTGCWFLSHVFSLPLVCAKHCSVCTKVSVPSWKVLLLGKPENMPTQWCPRSSMKCKPRLAFQDLEAIIQPDSVFCILLQSGNNCKLLIQCSSHGYFWLSGHEVLCWPVNVDTPCHWSRLSLCSERWLGCTLPNEAGSALYRSILSAGIHVYYEPSHVLAHFPSWSPCWGVLNYYFQFSGVETEQDHDLP